MLFRQLLNGDTKAKSLKKRTEQNLSANSARTVKTMRRDKAIAFVIISALALTLVRPCAAQNPATMKTFFSQVYPGIFVGVNASQEVSPAQNITLRLWVECRSLDVAMDSLNMSVYGFELGKEKILLKDVVCIAARTPLAFNQTRVYNYTVPVPSDVWDTTYAELGFSYKIADEPHEYNPGFSLTLVRNVYLENLERQLRSLNESYAVLNATYWALNGTYAQLNESYSELRQNYTSLQVNVGELDNVRRVVAILVVTAVFFIATTFYLVIRKPRESW